MKKQILYAAAAMVALAFTSCKKYEVSSPLNLDELQKVTVKGTLYAELDETNSEREKVPAGIKVTASIDLDDYGTGNPHNGKHFVSTTTDANGNFSLSIPVVSSGVDVSIYFEKFNYDVIEQGGVNQTLTRTYTFELNDEYLSSLGTGNSVVAFNIDELEYTKSGTDPSEDNFMPTTTKMLSGELEYASEVYEDISGFDSLVYSPIPAGSKVKVEITSYDEFNDKEYKVTKVVTVSSGGMYSVEVPIAENGQATLDFSGVEILQYDDNRPGMIAEYLYKYDLSAMKTMYNVDYTDGDYQYTQGTFVTELD